MELQVSSYKTIESSRDCMLSNSFMFKYFTPFKGFLLDCFISVELKMGPAVSENVSKVPMTNMHHLISTG